MCASHVLYIKYISKVLYYFLYNKHIWPIYVDIIIYYYAVKLYSIQPHSATLCTLSRVHSNLQAYTCIGYTGM